MAERQQEGMETVEHRGMRLAFRQCRVNDRAGGCKSRKFNRIVEGTSRMRLAQLATQVAQLLGEPCSPFDLDQIARLPDWSCLARDAAVDEARVPTMVAR